ncbi:MAG: hypothetical protein CVU87_03210 [Firmicutes bacterium HGW-Firmicutes-12]|jgi:hypothetical protein|nr:MAG: hypothetical protein CVU87_03210 [Firmicutes bacterium HGW-Firmicutes-12]
MRLPVQIVFVSLFLLLLIALPSQALYNDHISILNNYELAWKVFSLAGTDIKEIKLQAWGQISNRNMTEDEINSTYQLLAQALRIDALKKPVFQLRNDGIKSLSIIAENENGNNAQLSIQSIPDPAKGEGSTYIATLFTSDDPLTAQQAYNDLIILLRDIGFTEPIGITFKGENPGTTTTKIRNARIKDLAKVVNAEYIEGIVQDRYSSLCFYTSEGKQYLYIQGKKINLNIAFSIDELENTTHIYVGVPVIYQDY